MNDPNTLLRANGAFSGGSGALLLIGAAALDDAFGLDAWLLVVCGVALLGYGTSLWLAARFAAAMPAVRFATIMDFGWVIGAAIILVGFPTAMTPTGRIALLAVSVVVADFALRQVSAMRASGRPAI